MTNDDLADLGGHLTTKVLGRPHEHHRVLDSTSDRAAAWAREGAPHGALVTADAQLRGRGRNGRTWHSPPGANLYASLVLRPVAGIDALSLAVGLGLRDALAPWTDQVQLKWPNDLTVNGRKLGGILCEARWQGPRVEVIAGFGLNVHTQPFPDELASLATSLASVARVPVARTPILGSALAALEHTLETFWTDGFQALRTRYVAACCSLNREVTAEVDGERRRVHAEDIDEQGALVVRALTGTQRWRLRSAEIVL